jgi:hypothetical protein
VAYNKHTWVARQGIGLNKFTDQNGNRYEFTPSPDEVTQPGTPFSAEWMNEMEDGIASAGIIYGICETAAATAAKIVDTGGAPEQLANGDNFRILFVNEVQAGATLNINGIGAYPIIDNYTSAAIVKGDIPAGYVSDIVFKNNTFIILNAFVEDTDTDTVYEMVKVWENASPESAFTNQTISVNLSQYSMVAIEYRKHRNVASLDIVYCVVGGSYAISGATDRESNYNYFYLAQRKYTINNAGVTVSNNSLSNYIALYITSSTLKGSSDTALKDFCIPVRIYGIKGVKIS